MPQHHPDADIVAELVTDHREVEALFTKLESPLPPSERRDTLERVIAELVRHSIAEELYLYPATAERVPNGANLAAREVAEHADVERMLKALEGEDPQSPENTEVLRQLMAAVRGHVAEEEQELFPALRAVYSQAELDELGDKVRTAKAAAPTRPHPSTPHNPLVRGTLGPLVGLVDRTRDALSGRRTG